MRENKAGEDLGQSTLKIAHFRKNLVSNKGECISNPPIFAPKKYSIIRQNLSKSFPKYAKPA